MTASNHRRLKKRRLFHLIRIKTPQPCVQAVQYKSVDLLSLLSKAFSSAFVTVNSLRLVPGKVHVYLKSYKTKISVCLKDIRINVMRVQTF
ncbi:MAG: hypothetical protein ACFWUC_06220 [Oscillospiraceae bacterium]|jgi:coenzyme F420-reducing hydrogenase beta subunit